MCPRRAKEGRVSRGWPRMEAKVAQDGRREIYVGNVDDFLSDLGPVWRPRWSPRRQFVRLFLRRFFVCLFYRPSASIWEFILVTFASPWAPVRPKRVLMKIMVWLKPNLCFRGAEGSRGGRNSEFLGFFSQTRFSIIFYVDLC